ncbi:hypothetical protein K3X44_04440 [Aliiroseovarius crassostreae]|uniref:HEPN domain-containing protein n=1 Tax=Aliiroseovarius crassostreae TaxID=154981 RepID=UPI0022068307|nr:HEPN domain-containing protein [Aliiroseovarius crassostreae]UWQ02592.1 hypothetical protein K3X44_04440 [Aliiroseovarius crassostreae]
MANELSHFNKAIDRSKHLIALYEMVADTRQRSVRSDWANKFRKLMHWNADTKILRVDGKDSFLIIKNPTQGLTKEKFKDEYASELLRSSVVTSVSALDKYLHDTTLNRCFTLLRTSTSGLPKGLRKLELPASLAFEVQRTLKRDPKSRPGSKLKKELQRKLHLSTFQNAGGVSECMKLMGVADYWRKVADEFGEGMTSKSIQDKLNDIVMRRHQIVHEADLERLISSNRFPLRKIDKDYAVDVLEFMERFVNATEKVVHS